MMINAIGTTSKLNNIGSANISASLLIAVLGLCTFFYLLPIFISSSNSPWEYTILQNLTMVLIIGLLLLCLMLQIQLGKQLNNAHYMRDVARQNERAAVVTNAKLAKQQEQSKEDLEYSIGERNLELEITLRELSEKNAELERLSAIDTLTGLMNRGYFDKQIIAECRRSKRELTALGVAMLDIDFFKAVNDEHGHLGGDHCLQMFANVLTRTLKRPSDVICRYGGEEFVLLLPNTNEEGLGLILEKVRRNVEAEKITFDGKEIPITVSIGAASKVVTQAIDKDSIIALADKRLYQAKDNGRNCVVVNCENT
jgi:diguanylate cyclase (GGDEF)-like protein